LLFFVNCAFATELTDVAKVGEIWSGYDNGQVLFKVNIPHLNPANCGGSSFYVTR